MRTISLLPVEGIGELQTGDDLGALIAAHAELRDGDVVVVSSKAVSKCEGNVHRAEEISPSPFAHTLSALTGNAPEYCELVLRESAGLVRTAPGVVISRTHHGFVMANAGVDASNSGGEGRYITLPQDADKSARRVRESILRASGARVAVVVSDTFGRAWRNGQTDLAVGVSGLSPLTDYRGQTDDNGRPMGRTALATADELASAAELVRRKTGRIPAVIVRGFTPEGDGSVNELLMDPGKDLFK